MNTIRSHRYETGLTLLELLVSLAVLCLTAALLFEALRYGTRLWIQEQKRVGGAEAVAATQSFLRARLSSIDPFIPHDSAIYRAVWGTVDQLEFSAPPPAASEPGSFRYRIALRSTLGHRDLIVRWRRDWDGRVDPVAGAEWQEETLIPNVNNIEFGYLGKDANGERTWKKDWNESRPPRAIRLSVGFGTNDNRIWPRLVIATAIDADPLCEFDPVSQGCRV